MSTRSSYLILDYTCVYTSKEEFILFYNPCALYLYWYFNFWVTFSVSANYFLMWIIENVIQTCFSFHVLSVLLQRNQHYDFIWELVFLSLHLHCAALLNRSANLWENTFVLDVCTMYITPAQSLSFQDIKSWPRYLSPFH